MTKLKYDNKFHDPVLPTSSQTSVRSIEKLESSLSTNLVAFDYEFKRKPYASFNNYSIIPPIKNKNSNGHEALSDPAKRDEKNVERLLEQEMRNHTQTRISMENTKLEIRQNNSLSQNV